MKLNGLRDLLAIPEYLVPNLNRLTRRYGLRVESNKYFIIDMKTYKVLIALIIKTIQMINVMK